MAESRKINPVQFFDDPQKASKGGGIKDFTPKHAPAQDGNHDDKNQSSVYGKAAASTPPNTVDVRTPTLEEQAEKDALAADALLDKDEDEEQENPKSKKGKG